MTSLEFPAQFDHDVSQVIASYITDIPYRIRPEFADKIDPHRMYWYLSSNKSPHVIPILASKLPAVTYDIDWFALSLHPHLTYEFLSNNKDDIVWAIACKNPAVVDFIIDNPRYIRWCGLSHNTDPRVIDMIRSNPDKVDIDWSIISTREDMIGVIEDNLDKIDWCKLSANRAAIHILERNLDKVDFDIISLNTAAIDIIKNNMARVNINILCRNIAACNTLVTIADIVWEEIDLDEKSVGIIRELLKDPANRFILARLKWRVLSGLPCAIDIIEANLERAIWAILAINPAASHLIKKNIDKVHPNGLSMNSAVIDILLNNTSKIKWILLYKHNESIFEIDRELYKQRIKDNTNYVYNL